MIIMCAANAAIGANADIESDDIKDILSIAKHAEEEWAKIRSIEYPEIIVNLCMRLSEKHSNPNAYLAMQLIGGNFIAKENIDVLLVRQVRVARVLSMMPNSIPDESFDKVRSATFRSVMISVSKLRCTVIPNYVRRPAVMNPIAWMDARNEVVVKEQEKKLKENNENARMNFLQGVLDAIQKKEIPVIEAAIIKAYSKQPIRYEELRDYLILGQYSLSERVRIFSAVEKFSGERTPLFWDSPELEKIKK
jgi:hypothetical protein